MVQIFPQLGSEGHNLVLDLGLVAVSPWEIFRQDAMTFKVRLIFSMGTVVWEIHI